MQDQDNAAADAATKADEELRKACEAPMTREEAEKAIAEIDVERCKLSIVRQKWMAQERQIQLNLAALDEQLLALDMDRAVVFRRTLNKVPDAEAK